MGEEREERQLEEGLGQGGVVDEEVVGSGRGWMKGVGEGVDGGERDEEEGAGEGGLQLGGELFGVVSFLAESEHGR